MCISDARTERHRTHEALPRAAQRERTVWASAPGEPSASATVTWGIDVHDTTTVDLTGELGTLTAERVRKLFETTAETSEASVAIDMSDVTFIDSRGLLLFLRTQDRLAERGLRCRIVNPSKCVRRLFNLLSLEDRLRGR